MAQSSVARQDERVRWTNPLGVNLSPGRGVLYLISVTDDTGVRHEYLGQTKRAEKRFRGYICGVERIRAGLPQSLALGRKRYRAVHLALAKAIEFGWQYECYPLENVALKRLDQTEQQRQLEYDYKLNRGRKWLVAEYKSLAIADLYGGPEPDQQRDGSSEPV